MSFADISFDIQSHIFAVEFWYLHNCRFLSPYICLQILVLLHYQMLHFTLEKRRKGFAPESDGEAYSASPHPLAAFEIVFGYFTFVFAMNLVGISFYQRSHRQVTMYSV